MKFTTAEKVSYAVAVVGVILFIVYMSLIGWENPFDDKTVVSKDATNVHYASFAFLLVGFIGIVGNMVYNKLYK